MLKIVYKQMLHVYLIILIAINTYMPIMEWIVDAFLLKKK